MSILQYRLILALRPPEPNVLPGGLFRRAGAVSLGENVSECDILVSLARWARGRWIDFDIASPGVLRRAAWSGALRRCHGPRRRRRSSGIRAASRGPGKKNPAEAGF